MHRGQPLRLTLYYVAFQHRELTLGFLIAATVNNDSLPDTSARIATSCAMRRGTAPAILACPTQLPRQVKLRTLRTTKVCEATHREQILWASCGIFLLTFRDC